MNKITNADKKLIENADSATLDDWYFDLNKWGWPPELPDEEARCDVAKGRRVNLMSEIKIKLSNDKNN